MGEQRAWRDPKLLGLVLALMGAASGGFHYINLTFDDVFISFRYAENLARGEGLVFNPGERVEGFTNFLWTLLLAIPALLGAAESDWGMLWVAKLLGLACALGSIFFVWRTLSLRLGQEDRWGALAISSYLAGLAPFWAWSVVGLETPFVVLLITGAFYSFARESVDDQLAGSRSAVWLLLAALARPEPVVVAGLFVVARAVQLKRLREFPGAKIRAYFLTFAVPYAAFLAFRWGYYGDLLPNTYYAKLHDDPRAIHRGMIYVKAAFDDLSLGAVAGLVGLAFVLHQKVTVWGLLVLGVLGAQVLGVVYEGGDWMPAYRMLIPALPAFCLLLGEVWGASADFTLPTGLKDLEQAPTIRRAARRLFPLLLIGALAWGAWGSSAAVRVAGLPSGWEKIQLDAFIHHRSARWMKRELEPGLLAIGEAGVVPYVTGFPVLDLFGLTDRHIARLPGKMHVKFDVEYFFNRRPRYVYLLMFGPSGRKSPAHPHGRAILGDPRFSQSYRLMRENERVRIYERVD